MQEMQTLLPVGSVLLHRYRVESLLGKGGFSAVYLVRDLRSQANQYAIKELIDPDKKERQRFTFEGEVLKRLDHPALPRVYRVFDDAQAMRAYILMDYVEGQNLETLRQQRRDHRFSLSRVMQLMAPVVSAVSYLHEQAPPVIHRDIKPANIIVPPRGEETVLVDFGIAKEYIQDATTSMIRHASPGYGAPEQYDRGTSPRTDVYGMAATIYALLTGMVPPMAFTRITQRESKGVDPLVPASEAIADIPEYVSKALERAMAIHDEERYATVQEFWQALRPVSSVQQLPETPAVLAPPAVVLSDGDDAIVSATTAANVHAPETPRLMLQPAVAPASVRVPERTRRRNKVWLIVLAALVLLVLLGGSSFAMGLFKLPVGGGKPVVAATATVRHATATPVPVTPAARPTARPTQAAKPTEQATRASNSGYPSIAASYSGSIHNTPADVNGTMQLTQMQQNGGSISGYLALSDGLQGNGSFNGTVSTGRQISFIVDAYADHLPLLFQGQVASDGSMSGSYCSEQNNQCDYTDGGYGSWQVAPVGGGRSSSGS
jgi:eukaryotic-like serine/threonine-protein kinase